jgi:hypothetical protein
MPYIKADDGRRKALRNGEPALTAGELNYQIFWHVKHKDCSENLIRCFVEQFLGEKRNYQKYNDMTGALVRCYREIERRLKLNCGFLLEIVDSYDDEIAKYEDKKIEENGDVE